MVQGSADPFVPHTYVPPLVVLSALIAVWASYDALRLARRASAAQARARPIWLIAGALAMGIGARGTCPDCGTEQQLDLASRWRALQPVTCTRCQRGLRLSLA